MGELATLSGHSQHGGLGRHGEHRSLQKQPIVGPIYRRTGFHQDALTMRQPTPQFVKSAMATAAFGWPHSQNDLIDEMLGDTGDPISGAYAQRLAAVLADDWDIVPATDVSKSKLLDPKLAEAIADETREKVLQIRDWDRTLIHQSEAVGYGYAISQIVWTLRDREHVPVEVTPVLHNAVNGDSHDISRLRIQTSFQDTHGVFVDQTHYQWLVRISNPINNNPFRGGVLRPSLPFHLIRRYGMQWFAGYVELFGTPYRIGLYPEGANPEVRDALDDAMKLFGNAGFMTAPIGSDIKLVSDSRATNTLPQVELFRLVDEWATKRILGQTLTTDAPPVGSFALAKVQKNVRDDIIWADRHNEAQSIRDDLLWPILKFSRRAAFLTAEEMVALTPYFVRKAQEVTDVVVLSNALNVAINSLGMEVPASWAHDTLGIPMAESDDPEFDPDAALPGAPVGTPVGPSLPGGNPFGFKMDSSKAVIKNCTVNGTRFNVPRGTDANWVICQRPSQRVDSELHPRSPAPVGVLEEWIDEATVKSVRQANAVVDQVESGFPVSGDIDTVARSLNTKLDGLPTEEFEDALTDYFLATALVGALKGHSRIGSKKKKRRLSGTSRIIAQGEPSFGFLKGPFAAAVRALRERLLLPPDLFLTLETAARSHAGRVAGVYNMRLVQDIYEQATQTLEAGGTVRDFRLGLKQLPSRTGWTGEDPWHANLVMRQNSSMSYQAGHFESFQDAGVESWQFKTYRDSCPICKPVSDKVFAMSDRLFFPPLHFNCDCYSDPVFEEEPAARNVVASSSVDNPDYDESQQQSGAFKFDPASFARLEPLDLSAVPEPLQASFREFAASKGWTVIG